MTLQLKKKNEESIKSETNKSDEELILSIWKHLSESQKKAIIDFIKSFM